VNTTDNEAMATIEDEFLTAKQKQILMPLGLIT
jgi:hypothetical protein